VLAAQVHLFCPQSTELIVPMATMLRSILNPLFLILLASWEDGRPGIEGHRKPGPCLLHATILYCLGLDAISRPIGSREVVFG
jgi:hypothetical protein